MVRSLFATFLSCVSVVSHIYFSLSNNFHLLEKTPAQQLTVVSKMVVVCPRLNTTSPIGWHTEHSAPIGGAVNMKLRNLPRTTNSCNNFSANNNVLGVSNTSHHMGHYTTRHVPNLFLFDAGYKICVVNNETFCEAQARVRQGSARDGPYGERPQSLNPSLELTLKLVATTHPLPTISLILLN